jgi:hypothetical protein
MADVDGPGPDRFHGRDDVDDLSIWHVHGSVPAAAAGPVDEEPRRDGGPPVLRGERTRSLEPNRLTKSLKAGAAPLNDWQQLLRSPRRVAWGWGRPFFGQ